LDGGFSIANVPPGRYTLRARSNARDGQPVFASLPLSINGVDVSTTVALAPGATINGTVTLEATQSTTIPDVTQFSVSTAAADPGERGPASVARAEKGGAFRLDGVPEGPHWIRGQAPRGWMLKSVGVDGRDVVDTPFELRSGQNLAGVSVVFTDRLSEIIGTLTNAQGVPLTEYTVLAFPTDSTRWGPQSRQIVTTRPDQNGRFQLRGLPSGEYYLAAVDPTEPDEWFEPAFLDQHRAAAACLTLGEGQVKTQDFRVVTR
jgi:hypothetical protein